MNIQDNFTFFSKNVLHRKEGDMLSIKIIKGKYFVATLKDSEGRLIEVYGKNFTNLKEEEGGKTK